MNFEVNNYMATNRDIIKFFDFSVAHVVMVFLKIKRLGIILDPSDVILDPQVNFEVNNPMASRSTTTWPPTGTSSNFLILVWHMLLG